MQIRAATESHLEEVASWFESPQSCLFWAGPGLRYPFNLSSLRAGIQYDLVPSLAFLKGSEPLGFGQYYCSGARCQLARIAVAPRYRGFGFGAMIVRELCRRGCGTTGSPVCSLYVYSDNLPALNLYRSLGFTSAPYPAGVPAQAGCLYMIAPSDRVCDSTPC